MGAFQRFGSRLLILGGVATMLFVAPIFGQQPAQGYYTHRYGYNPGYYGSSQSPRDSRAKLGQPSRTGNYTHWFKPTPPPAPPAPPLARRWNSST